MKERFSGDIFYYPPLMAYFISLFLVTLISLTSSAIVEEHYTNCASVNSTCGSSLDINYPFWDDSRPSYCGHPGFKLECHSNSFTIQIKNQTYNVLHINYKSNVFTLSKQQFSQGPCPTTKSQLVNSTFDLTLFNFTSNSQNVTLFYNCSKISDTNPSTGFACLTDVYADPPIEFKSTVNFLVTDEKWINELRNVCMIDIYVPVFRTKVIDLENYKLDVDSVVSNGFELKWGVDENHQCQDCLVSGGRCGYLDKPVCFCQNAVYNTTCLKSQVSQDPKKRKRVISIVLGIAGAVGVVLLISIVFFLYRRRNMSNHSVSQRDRPNTFSTTLDPNGSTYFGVKVFRYSELEEATEDFNSGKVLGRGGYGTVYHGTLRDGREVAVKCLKENNKERAKEFLNEVEILANVHHKNLVTLYGCTSHQSKQLVLVYEYVSNGTLADHLHGTKANLRLLPWATRLRIALETTDALVYLHSADIIHRDVKTQNILLDMDFSVKVADFGLSRLFPLDVTHVSTAPQGTRGYMDPEYHQCYQLTEKSDVYSLGVVLAEIISSKPPIDITRQRAEINLSGMITSKILSDALDDFVDPSLGFDLDDVKNEITVVAELAFECLQSTRDMRPSMKQVLERLSSIKAHKDAMADNAF